MGTGPGSRSASSRSADGEARHPSGRQTERVAAVIVVTGTVAALVGVSVAPVPAPALDEPLWYAIAALAVGYWAALARWAIGRRA